MRRRDWLLGLGAAGVSAQDTPWRLTDVTTAALRYRHHTGAFGAKYLPETMGPGCAFLDYDGDGWLDILLVNGKDWPGRAERRSTLQLWRNNGNGTFMTRGPAQSQ